TATTTSSPLPSSSPNLSRASSPPPSSLRCNRFFQVDFPARFPDPYSFNLAFLQERTSMAFQPLVCLAAAFCVCTLGMHAKQHPSSNPRARDLGVPFDGTPGPLNAITDVSGVTVGHTTLISGEGKLQVGKGPVRTGVTAILPRGQDSMNNPVFAGWW